MRFSLLLMVICLAACATQTEQAAAPTATLLPILSQTPRYTATQVPTRTAIPTFTETPSETPIPPSPTLSLTPSPTPPITGIIQSLQSVNVREGPGVTYREIDALTPGTGVVVLFQNGEWYNIRYEDRDGEVKEGWAFANLVRVVSTSTPVPTSTPSPDLTALFLGTPLPTAILGGGTVTPTPPGSITTPTPALADTNAQVASAITPTTASFIPVIDLDSLNMTATALAFGIATPTLSSSQTPTATASDSSVITVPTIDPSRPTLTLAPGTGVVQEDVRIFALCDNPALGGSSAPTNLGAGSTIIIWWSWFARTEEQIQQHLQYATYEVRVDGELLTRLQSYRTPVTRPANDYVVSWTVPYEKPLTVGQHQITYRVTWAQTITDGYKNFGPGTNTPLEEGSCTFTVR